MPIMESKTKNDVPSLRNGTKRKVTQRDVT